VDELQKKQPYDTRSVESQIRRDNNYHHAHHFAGCLDKPCISIILRKKEDTRFIWAVCNVLFHQTVCRTIHTCAFCPKFCYDYSIVFFFHFQVLTSTCCPARFRPSFCCNCCMCFFRFQVLTSTEHAVHHCDGGLSV
jgi:hypothetical protein